MDDVIRYKFTQRFKMRPAQVNGPIILIRDDGTIRCIPANTLLPVPIEDEGEERP